MRIGLLIAGLLALAAAWAGPLPSLAQQAFFAHMLMHMLVVAVAAPLLALAVAGGRYDPVESLPAFYAPIPASVGELMLVWAWHAPALHHLARIEPVGLIAEQATFLLAGLWIWLSAFGGDPTRNRGRGAAGVVGLLLTSMHMTLLGALLALAPRPVYEHHTGFTSLSPLQDQHLGGAVMILIGGIAYLSGGLVLIAGLLRQRSPEDRAPA
jgi:putative membrane protein